MPLLVSGYKRMGKDTFYNNVASGVYLDSIYDFYILPTDRSCMFRMFLTKHGKRHAFADPLKYEVAQYLGVSIERLEEIKDEIMCTPYLFRTFVPSIYATNRDLMKDIANANRIVDENYYARPVARSVGPFDFITDHRYPNETKEITNVWPLCTMTARVIREGVPVPALDDISERGLDNEVPEVLITSKNIHLNPHYTNVLKGREKILVGR